MHLISSLVGVPKTCMQIRKYSRKHINKGWILKSQTRWKGATADSAPHCMGPIEMNKMLFVEPPMNGQRDSPRMTTQLDNYNINTTPIMIILN